MRHLTLWVVVLLLAMVGPASADTLEVTAVPLFYNGISTGILKGQWNGNPIDLVCNDWDHTTYLNDPFEVRVSGIPALEFVRFGGDTDHTRLEHYQQAAWLLTQLWEADTLPNIVGLQYALWAVFNPTHSFPVILPPPTGEGATWFAKAQNPANYNRPYPNVLIFTDNGLNQEFMTIVPTPEPSTWSLVILGVAALVTARVLGRRKQLVHMPCYPVGRMNNRNRPTSTGSPSAL